MLPAVSRAISASSIASWSRRPSAWRSETRLARPQNRNDAVRLLRELHADSGVVMVPMSDDLYVRALDLFERRPDKEWSLIDCVSFVVMSDRGIRSALTADGHFEQAGFEPLLRRAS